MAMSEENATEKKENIFL